MHLRSGLEDRHRTPSGGTRHADHNGTSFRAPSRFHALLLAGVALASPACGGGGDGGESVSGGGGGGATTVGAGSNGGSGLGAGGSDPSVAGEGEASSLLPKERQSAANAANAVEACKIVCGNRKAGCKQDAERDCDAVCAEETSGVLADCEEFARLTYVCVSEEGHFCLADEMTATVGSDCLVEATDWELCEAAAGRACDYGGRDERQTCEEDFAGLPDAFECTSTGTIPEGCQRAEADFGTVGTVCCPSGVKPESVP